MSSVRDPDEEEAGDAGSKGEFMAVIEGWRLGWATQVPHPITPARKSERSSPQLSLTRLTYAFFLSAFETSADA